VTTRGWEVIPEVIRQAQWHNGQQYDEIVSSHFRYLDWERSRGERAKIRAVLRKTLGDLSQEERKTIRKLIESLLKGGEELEEVHEADHAAAKGMMQQVVVILGGLDK
jgi:hypothetical protein